MTTEKSAPITKLTTGIKGLDHITNGGLPRGRTTLVSGTAGSAKTILAVQFLVQGIVESDEHAVFVTLEESPEDIRRNVLGFGWDIQRFEAEGKWAFVDGALQADVETIEAGAYDLGALIARIDFAVNKVGAKRLSMDSIGAIFGQFSEQDTVRREIHRATIAIKNLGLTAILTSERTEEYGDIARFGVEEFVTDNVIILRNVLDNEKRRRTIEILKLRGTNHNKGEYPFTIATGRGVVIIPLSEIELQQNSSDIRVTSGNEPMDQMCGGGFFRDSVILVSGATGTGKTLMVTEFIGGGLKSGERCLLFAFEESREQLFRNAKGWGLDFEELEHNGKLLVICKYPEVKGLEDHLIEMKETILEFKPNRVGVDSLSALERVSTPKGFREFIIGITSFLKQQEVVGLFSSTTPDLLGGSSITEAHISTITDSIILLRYVEMFGEMRRGVTVLKMRGSMHDKDIREFNIDSEGMHIGDQFRGVTGILTGNQVHVMPRDIDRLDGMFSQTKEP